MATTRIAPEEVTSAGARAAKAVLDDAIAAFNARQYDKYLENFTDDLESYTGFMTPLRWEGLSAWRELIGGIEKLTAVTYEQRQTTVRSYNDDTALVNGYFVFTTVSQQGVVETQSGRASFTLVKIAGDWRVANQHYSPMF